MAGAEDARERADVVDLLGVTMSCPLTTWCELMVFEVTSAPGIATDGRGR
jgi:hypothetical protein